MAPTATITTYATGDTLWPTALSRRKALVKSAPLAFQNFQGGRELTSLQDDGNAEEDWTKPAPIENSLPWVEGWTPAITEMKLMWRNPQPVIVSAKGRVVQIGDSAHAFLPSSASGATMAMEDAAALDMYDAAASHLEKGSLFANTNIPSGYKYKPWKIQDLLAASDRGEKVVDEGDWS
ncbi:hypothetical protein B0J12DRAFT_728344 [Macrophomina phaseolina]|uniref:FAD-binding domain-containing protein n=1 Tax=Macrophomina phaseolina TaxID=35725 RepID=A0ABQ8GAE2_9PEZI|nr:hypothetical protein B0J12DRAFT_728344 [Macrophomina phaseolina]